MSGLFSNFVIIRLLYDFSRRAFLALIFNICNKGQLWARNIGNMGIKIFVFSITTILRPKIQNFLNLKNVPIQLFLKLGLTFLTLKRAIAQQKYVSNRAYRLTGTKKSSPYTSKYKVFLKGH